MRLGQLARKLALRPSEIVDFLAKQNIQIEEGSNTRLEDADVTRIMNHYAPAMVKAIEAEMAADHEGESKTQSAVAEDQKIYQNNTVIDMSTDQILEVEKDEIAKEFDSMSIVSDQSLESMPDVIRAPKVELPGLKVIGKIDIPEPKKKEAPLEEELLVQEVPPLDEKPSVENKRLPQKRREREERPRRNPIAIQRDREAMEAEQKRREEARREKEKRTQNYLKKVKTSQPIKSVRLVNEQVVEMSAELNDIPKTWWGRFKKWLTT